MRAILLVTPVLLALGACAGGTGSSQTLAASAAKSGEVVYVGCLQVPVHQQPDGFSPTIGRLGFGQAVRIVQVAGQYKPHGRDETLPSWAFVDVNGARGYIGARCLVSEQKLPSQREDVAKTKADEDARLATRGFGDEQGAETAVAARGAAGRARMGAANFQAFDSAVGRGVAADPSNQFRAFRQQGGVGEYRP